MVTIPYLKEVVDFDEKDKEHFGTLKKFEDKDFEALLPLLKYLSSC